MKHQAIVGNIGHFDNEIDMAGLVEACPTFSGQHQAAGRRVPSSRTVTLIIMLSVRVDCSTSGTQPGTRAS